MIEVDSSRDEVRSERNEFDSTINPKCQNCEDDFNPIIH